MSMLIEGGSDWGDGFIPAKTYDIYKQFPWSKWEFGVKRFAFKEYHSGSLDKLDYLTGGELKKDQSMYFI